MALVISERPGPAGGAAGKGASSASLRDEDNSRSSGCNCSNPLFALPDAKKMKVHVHGLQLLTRTELTHSTSTLLDGVPQRVPEG